MGQLVVGLAGAGLGFALGGPTGAQIGWMLGAFAWNLLDPPKVQGPRLSDTKVQGADYGAMIPIVYGTVRVGGIGMGQGSTANGPNQFTEHEEKSGGKGGPEITNYRYTLSFANEICEGPIEGVWRRWANGRLITEAAAPATDLWPYTLYYGSTTQEPDPTMEIIYGAGDVCPMRGRAYEVVEEVNVEDFGNARPNVEYEVFTVAGPYPWRVSNFLAHAGTPGARSTHYADGVITVGIYQTASLANGHYWEYQYTLAGVLLESWDAEVDLPGFPNNAVQGLTAATDGTTWYEKHTSITTITSNPFGGAVLATGIGESQAIVYQNGFIYGCGRGTLSGQIGVIRFPATDGLISTDTGTYDSFIVVSNYSTGDTLSNWVMGQTNQDDVVYVACAKSPPTLYEYEADLSALRRSWDLTAVDAVQDIINGVGFTVYERQNGKLILSADRGNVGGKNASGYVLNDDGTVTYAGAVPAEDGYISTVSLLGEGPYALVYDGVICLEPPPAKAILGDIVSDLFQRGGLDAGQIDTTDLTQEVRGFVVGSQMSVRNAIDILRKAYFFDVTEYDGHVVCVNRGHDAIATIPDDDLAAHEPGAEPPEPLDVTRVPEAELPRTVFINYYAADNDHQRGSQYWRRTVTSSQSDVTLDLPLVFTETEALMRAQWHMHFAWLERDRFTWFTTRKWAKLVPTNVVVVRGVNIRITSRVESPNGLIKFDGVRAFAGPYSVPITTPINGEVPGSPGSGQPPQTPPSGKADTGLVLIDGPLVSDGDSATAFRAAMYKDGTGAWPGAALYRSVDGGTTYDAVASASSAAVIGTVAAALGGFAGGNVPDETNVITVVLQSGTLESTTADGLQNGLHLIALGSPSTGWEFLQYRTATLVSGATYQLSGLLRGRLGTEWMIGAHGADEILVLVSSTVLVPGTFAEIGIARKYKAATYGTGLADAIAQDFANTGVALKPVAPVILGGGRDASGDLTLHWASRRRGPGGWPNGVDLPATDGTNWQVEIYPDGTYTYGTELRAFGVTAETVTYTAAQQTADFGSPQSTVYWAVAQIGSAGLGYFAQAAT